MAWRCCRSRCGHRLDEGMLRYGACVGCSEQWEVRQMWGKRVTQCENTRGPAVEEEKDACDYFVRCRSGRPNIARSI